MTLQGDRQRRDCPPVGHPFDLSGRVAVVTGGSSGIGAGIAAGLARAGTDVSIWGRDDARSAAVADELSAHGHWALAVHCGVTDPVDSRRRLRQLLIKPRENHGFELNPGGPERGEATVGDAERPATVALHDVNKIGEFAKRRDAPGRLTGPPGDDACVRRTIFDEVHHDFCDSVRKELPSTCARCRRRARDESSFRCN